MRDGRGVSAARACGDDGSRFSLKKTVLLGAAIAVLAAGACDRMPGAAGGAAPPAVSAAALKTAADDPAVKAFYQKRNWKAAWSEASAEALVQALQAAPRHGLNVARFADLVDESNTGAVREARLTQAALAYAEALARGAVNPKKIEKIWALDGNEVDLAAGLNQALQTGSVDAWLSSLAPQDAEYAALSDAYVAARAQADQAAASPIPAGPAVRAGASDPRVATIAQRLIAARYLAGTPQTGADGVFTPQIADAVKTLQRDSGRPPTGVVDDATLALVNEAPAALSRQLAVNMERRRWLKREVPATRVDVNTAAAELVYLHDGQPVQAAGGESALERAGGHRRRGTPPQGRRLPGAQWLHDGRWPARPAARPRCGAGPGEVRHAEPARHLPARHPGEGSVRSGRAAPQPWLRARRAGGGVRPHASAGARQGGGVRRRPRLGRDDDRGAR
jgi:peptidoglycan hydrolase-like protein with peptidoglycan-binding domain